MKLEDLVPDRELCEKWKSIGGRQDTLYCWYNNLNLSKDDPAYRYYNEYIIEKNIGNKEDIAAPTVGELMEWMRKNDIVVFSCHDESAWGVEVYKPLLPWVEGKNLPNTLLKMALEVEGK